MGACQFRERIKAKDARSAYTSAVEDARSEYGNDYYNGTISTTGGFRDVTKEYKASGLTLDAFVEREYDKMGKGDCACIEVTAPVVKKAKTRSTVKNIPTKGTRKWELEYAVYSWNDRIKGFKTKKEAIDAAKAHTEKTERSTTIEVEKVTKGSTVARVEYKPVKGEALGTYLFWGWASE